VAELALIESHLGRGRPRYQVQEVFELGLSPQPQDS
jgi:2'-5' RNA ligase